VLTYLDLGVDLLLALVPQRLLLRDGGAAGRDAVHQLRALEVDQLGDELLVGKLLLLQLRHARRGGFERGGEVVEPLEQRCFHLARPLVDPVVEPRVQRLDRGRAVLALQL